VRILVTGVSGQVGSAIVPRFARFGTVIAADRRLLDLSEPAGIARTLDEIAPDFIVNPAAYTAVDRAEDERDLAFRVNAEAPEALARWASGKQVPLIQFSTDYVYDGAGATPKRETDPVGPLNVYGASKLAGEEAVRAAGGPHLVIRTSWVYAAGGTNFLRTIARLARERDELTIVADQVGSPTSAAFIADALADIVSTKCHDLAAAFSEANNLVHLCAGGQTNWHGFACAIVAGLKDRNVSVRAQRVKPIATKDYPTKAVRPLNSRLDLAHLDRAFGINPPSWDALLETELDQFVAASA
jgi:dTDP-4-dehydrorhamnose reductase